MTTDANQAKSSEPSEQPSRLKKVLDEVWIKAAASIIVLILTWAAGFIGYQLGILKARERFVRQVQAAPQVYLEELDKLIKEADKEHDDFLPASRALVSTRDELRGSLVTLSNKLDSDIDTLAKQVEAYETARQTYHDDIPPSLRMQLQRAIRETVAVYVISGRQNGGNSTTKCVSCSPNRVLRRRSLSVAAQHPACSGRKPQMRGSATEAWALAGRPEAAMGLRLFRREDGLPDWAWVVLGILLINVHKNYPGLRAVRAVLVTVFGGGCYSAVDIRVSPSWRVAIGLPARQYRRKPLFEVGHEPGNTTMSYIYKNPYTPLAMKCPKTGKDFVLGANSSVWQISDGGSSRCPFCGEMHRYDKTTARSISFEEAEGLPRYGDRVD
jgi:hypothetical protein